MVTIQTSLLNIPFAFHLLLNKLISTFDERPLQSHVAVSSQDLREYHSLHLHTIQFVLLFFYLFLILYLIKLLILHFFHSFDQSPNNEESSFESIVFALLSMSNENIKSHNQMISHKA